MGYKFDTLQVHGGHTPDRASLSRAVPIYQSTSFVFEDSGHAASLFDLSRKGNIYTRISNPTTAVLEDRVTLLEDGVGSVATASGTAAILYSIFNIAGAGDEIISSRALYGGTTHLFESTIKNMGIRVNFVNINDPNEIKDLITDRTKAIFTETVGNPMNTVADLAMIAETAHDHGIPLIVDNTVTTPYLLRPFEHGADIVVHSLTKFMGGHGVSIGGIVTDSGKTDWDAFKRLSTPDPDLNGLNFKQSFGDAAYIARLRTVVLRDTGACISPFNAFTILLGIETLSLRMARHCENAMKVAEFLENHPRVQWVNYPGLKNHPDHDLAARYLKKGFGAIISFGPKGGYETARNTVDRVRLISHLANIGDAKSLIIHPASTTHQQLNAQQQKASGIVPEMIRLSIGIEDPDDIISDLDQVLKGA
ncbi:MAG: O-acetylhomoserine aminocarboxypropyltransferase/cysteine synthase [Deltaproteobacteria bacterium]|nr:O-acetylhomoserine aminocarboxypropyltransferase/cysteine synthase [Deltaproteobacteria bacterium]